MANRMVTWLKLKMPAWRRFALSGFFIVILLCIMWTFLNSGIITVRYEINICFIHILNWTNSTMVYSLGGASPADQHAIDIVPDVTDSSKVFNNERFVSYLVLDWVLVTSLFIFTPASVKISCSTNTFHHSLFLYPPNWLTSNSTYFGRFYVNIFR